MTLSREKRLRKRRDFLRVQKYGFRSFGRFVVAIFRPDKDCHLGKIGITVPKKVGPAHVRNKVKRRIRHVMRLHQKLFQERLLVLVARESINNASFPELAHDVIETCKKLRAHRPTHSSQRNALKIHTTRGHHEHSI